MAMMYRISTKYELAPDAQWTDYLRSDDLGSLKDELQSPSVEWPEDTLVRIDNMSKGLILTFGMVREGAVQVAGPIDYYCSRNFCILWKKRQMNWEYWNTSNHAGAMLDVARHTKTDLRKIVKASCRIAYFALEYIPIRLRKLPRKALEACDHYAAGTGTKEAAIQSIYEMSEIVPGELDYRLQSALAVIACLQETLEGGPIVGNPGMAMGKITSTDFSQEVRNEIKLCDLLRNVVQCIE